MATFGGRGKRPGRPTRVGGQNEIYIVSPLKKDQDAAMVWVLDNNPPVVVNEAGNPVDEDGHETTENSKMIPNWYNFEQHYDPRVKRSWPCATSEDAVECVGCDFPVEDPTNEDDIGLSIQNTSSAYVIPVVDEKGYVSLIQLGWGLFNAFVDSYREYGTLTDAWYRIRRSKAGNKITYGVTKTDNRERPEVKIEVPDESYVDKALGKRYLEAMERYGYEPGDAGADDAATVGGDEGQNVTQDPAPADDPSVGEWDLHLVAKEASLGELKDWLSNIPEKFGGPRNYPKNVTRPVLQGLVETAQSGFQDEPPY